MLADKANIEQERVLRVWREKEVKDVHSSAYEEPFDTLNI